MSQDTRPKSSKGARGGKRDRVASTPRDRNSNKFAPLADPATDPLVCTGCQITFTEECDHLVQCERCNEWSCQKCSSITDSEYEILTNSKINIHYFCNNCEQAAMTAVLTDAQVEEKCKKYCQAIELRIDTMEKEIQAKAQKDEVNNMKEQIKKNEHDITHLTCDITKIDEKVTLRTEKEEKQKREKNIVIRGLPETEEDDTILVKDVLHGIGLPDITIERVDRIGVKRTEQNMSDASNTPHSRNTSRPVRVKLASLDDKKGCLMNATKIRKHETIKYNCKKIFIVPDLTKLEREQDFNLRRELQKKREEQPTAKFIVKKGCIIKLN